MYSSALNMNFVGDNIVIPSLSDDTGLINILDLRELLEGGQDMISH